MTNNVVGNNQSLGKILAAQRATDEHAAHHTRQSISQELMDSGSKHGGSRRPYSKPHLHVLAIGETERIAPMSDASETYTPSESRFERV
jgi:hypothetical protein